MRLTTFVNSCLVWSPKKGEDNNGVSLKFTLLDRVFRPTLEELREGEKIKQKGKKKTKGQQKKKMTEGEEKCNTRAYLFVFFFGEINSL